MRTAESFDLRGKYRVQSKRSDRPSRLFGRWVDGPISGVDSGIVNDRLRSDVAWRGEALVNIRAALVEHREGEFADEHDILYKRSHFERELNSDCMTSDLVDVRKAAARWIDRRPQIEQLFGIEAAKALETRIGDIEQVAALEYYFHEAGHCLGYDTASKYQDGYFRINGRTVWPLVYVEELRADLLSFGLAADVLSAKHASSVFLYNILLRLGSHREGVLLDARHPYGTIPHMLFTLLRQMDFVRVSASPNDRGCIEIATTDDAQVIQIMLRLSDYARAAFIEPINTNGTDAALQAAVFYREILNEESIGTFNSIVEAS